MTTMQEIADEMTWSEHHNVQFWDFNSITNDGTKWHALIQNIAEHHYDDEIDMIVGLDARGFLISGALGFALGIGSVTARKPGKLPGDTVSVAYGKEYEGDDANKRDELHLQTTHIKPGMRVLIVDDVLATGGTAEACCALVEKLGAVVVGVTVVIELPELGARGAKLSNYNVHSVISIVDKTPVVGVEYCVDILATDKNTNDLILIERQKDPTGIAMPGGRIEPGESVNVAARRELKEETNCLATELHYIGVLSGLERDPRGVKISLVMEARVDSSNAVGEMVKNQVITRVARIASVEDLPTNTEFVCDHGLFVRKYWAQVAATKAA